MKLIRVIYRKIKAVSANEAMRVVKEKYPYARLITYKFDKDMRYELDKDYINRTITVAIIKDFRQIREEM